MKRTFFVTAEVKVRITVDEEGATDELGSPWNPARMDTIYEDVRTPRQMLSHWAYNAIANGVDNAGRLDGWVGEGHRYGSGEYAPKGGAAVWFDIDDVDIEDVREYTGLAGHRDIRLDEPQPREEWDV